MRFAAHTLSNYLTVTAASVDLLRLHFKEHPDEEIRIWLDRLHHATALMMHSVLELMNAPVAEKEEFLWEKVDLQALVRRACDYYRRVADPKQISISLEADVSSPFVWADRVAVAAVLDNLLSNAVKFSSPQKHVWVGSQWNRGIWCVLCRMRGLG